MPDSTHPLATRTFPRPQSGGPTHPVPASVTDSADIGVRYHLPHGHGGPGGTEPQPLTSSPQMSSTGKEAGIGVPLQSDYEIAVHGRGKAREDAIRRLSPAMRSAARMARRQDDAGRA